jgi:hypothetical protein
VRPYLDPVVFYKKAESRRADFAVTRLTQRAWLMTFSGFVRHHILDLFTSAYKGCYCMHLSDRRPQSVWGRQKELYWVSWSSRKGKYYSNPSIRHPQPQFASAAEEEGIFDLRTITSTSALINIVLFSVAQFGR